MLAVLLDFRRWNCLKRAGETIDCVEVQLVSLSFDQRIRINLNWLYCVLSLNSPRLLFDYVGDVVFVDLKNVGLVKIVLFRLLRPQLVIHVVLFGCRKLSMPSCWELLYHHSSGLEWQIVLRRL